MTLPRKPQLRRIWPEMDRTCVVCGKPNAELAHVSARTHDHEWSLKQREDDIDIDYAGSRTIPVCETRVIPLCGPAPDTNSCHGRYDAGRLDILPYLSPEQQIQAVADLGLYRAYQRLSGGDV